MKNYIMCSCCHCRIYAGSVFVFKEMQASPTDLPVCIKCAGAERPLTENDPYISDFWKQHGKEWADEADKEYEEQCDTANDHDGILDCDIGCNGRHKDETANESINKRNVKQIVEALLNKVNEPKRILFSEEPDGSNTHVISFVWNEHTDSWYLMLDYFGGDAPCVLRTDSNNDFDEFEEELIFNTAQRYFDFRNLEEVYLKSEGE